MLSVNRLFFLVLFTNLSFHNIFTSAAESNKVISCIDENHEPGKTYGELFLHQGGPLSGENSWQATLVTSPGTINRGDIEQDVFTYSPIEMRFSAPATIRVTIDDYNILNLSNDTDYSFSLAYTFNATYPDMEISVNGKRNGLFPYLTEFTFGGADVCTLIKQKKDKFKCGRRLVQHQGLITNSYPTKKGDWPWHAAIYHNYRRISEYKCGGTLISSNYVLTAAHCIAEGTGYLIASRIRIKLGLYDRSISDRNVQEFRANKVIPHGDFRLSDLQDDIALIQLATEAIFNNYVQPICLWPNDRTDIRLVENKVGFVIGWGINENERHVDILAEGRMPIVSHLQCLESGRAFYATFLSSNNFCAGFRNGTSVCNGDSGGGLFLEDNKVFSIRGLVSLAKAKYGDNICDPNDYVIFTDVAQYLDWIEHIMNEN